MTIITLTQWFTKVSDNKEARVFKIRPQLYLEGLITLCLNWNISMQFSVANSIHLIAKAIVPMKYDL